MERKTLAPTFLDALLADRKPTRADAFFARVDALLDWPDLTVPLAPIFKDSPQGGRPHEAVVTYLKCLLLQKWFNLSDPALEEHLTDRLSFRKFLGLSMSDKVPDAEAVGDFRRALLAQGLLSALFERVNAQLERRGLILREGTLVDATIVEASLGTKREDGSKTADPCATFTQKRGRTYFGYKAHIAADKRGMIKDFVYDTAKVHDSRHADQLLETERHEAYADSAYMDAQRSAALQARGVKDAIAIRRVRGQKELTQEQKAHNRMVAGVRAMVEHPFAWMAKMGFDRARYRGLTRNALDFGLECIGYNVKRALSLASPLALGAA